MGAGTWRNDREREREAAAAERVREADAARMIARLEPGTWVGHANPELADWVGQVTANRRGRWVDDRTRRDVWVVWMAGEGAAGQKPAAGWIEATALTIAGRCPHCGQDGHEVIVPNVFYGDRGTYYAVPGWQHGEDSRCD